MKTNGYYVTIYFPEGFKDREPGGVPVRFIDSADAENWLRYNDFTFCPVHVAWAKLDTITANDGRRCRVDAVKDDIFTVGWLLNYATAERGAR